MDKIVQRALDSEIDIELVDNDVAKRKPLHMAIIKQHTNGVRMLLNAKANTEAKITYHGEQDMTPLLMVSMDGKAELIPMLIEARANIDAATTYKGVAGMTPMLIACIDGSTGRIQALLDSGVSIEASQGQEGPLHTASYFLR